MKIVCVLGSQRSNSKSSKIALKILDQIKRYQQPEIKIFKLSRMKIDGCTACNICKDKEEKCVRKDNTTEIIDAIAECDLLIISTPIYFSNIPGQLKSLIDRTYSFQKPNYLSENTYHSRLASGKTLFYIQTNGADVNELYSTVTERIISIFKMHGFTNSYCVNLHGMDSSGYEGKLKDAYKKFEKIVDELYGNK